MDITVSGRKTTVTDALRAHVDEKIGDALKVFDIEPMTADVVLRYEKNPSNPEPAIVEVTVRARGRSSAWPSTGSTCTPPSTGGRQGHPSAAQVQDQGHR